MGNNIDIILKTKRDNFSYQFRPSIWPSLEELRGLMNCQQMGVFGEKYGNLLSLLDARVDDKAERLCYNFMIQSYVVSHFKIAS